MAIGRKIAALVLLCLALLLASAPACEAGGWKGKRGGRTWASRKLLKPWEGKKGTGGGPGRWGSAPSRKKKTKPAVRAEERKASRAARKEARAPSPQAALCLRETGATP